MSRSYRLLILALGLILCAASPGEQRQNSQQHDSHQKITDPLERIAGALNEANKPKREAVDCPEGGNDRKSDLCAQWKAADAAAASAYWAFWTFIATFAGLIIGGGTLIAAWLAARWAKKAADFTEAGAQAAADAVSETKRIGEAQIRCYPTAISAQIGHPNGDTAMIKIRVKNTGLSPARNVTFKADVSHFIGRTTLVKSDNGPESIGFEIDIPAGQEDDITCSVNIKVRNDIPKLQDDSFHVLVSVIAHISCIDVFGEIVSQSDKFSKFLPKMPGNEWIQLNRDSRVKADELKIAT